MPVAKGGGPVAITVVEVEVVETPGTGVVTAPPVVVVPAGGAPADVVDVVPGGGRPVEEVVPAGGGVATEVEEVVGGCATVVVDNVDEPVVVSCLLFKWLPRR